MSKCAALILLGAVTIGCLPSHGQGFQATKFLPVDKADSVDLGDYDQDGSLDLLIGSTVLGEAGVWNQGAKPLLAPKTSLPTGILRWADIDHDGYLDIVASNAVLINDGLGAFKYRPMGLPEIGNATLLIVVDYDLDGDLDLLYRGEWVAETA